MKTLILGSAATLALLFTGCGSGGTQLPPNEIAVTPVGAVRGSAVQMMVPTTGATLTSADGRLTLEVPSGAIAASQMLTIQTINNEAPGGVGTAYRLGPDGTTFSTPVKLTFNYTNADLLGSEPQALKVAYQDSKGSWNAVKGLTLDTTAKTVSVQTKHFSDWAALAGFQLRPATAMVKAGGSIDLVINVCSNAVAGTDELTELLNKCRPDPDFFTVQQWAVNSVVSGNGTVGTIRPGGETQATYQAPAIAPASNPVAVSASVTDKSTRRKTVLLSNIFVDAHPPLQGTINSTREGTGGLTVSSTAKLTFEYDSAMQMYRPRAGGSLKAAWQLIANGCETNGLLMADIGTMDANVVVTDLAYFPAGRTTGTYNGTTTCPALHTTEIFTRTDEVEWWLTSVESQYAIKPDGSLNDTATFVTSDTNEKVTTDWMLVPVASP